MTDPDDIDPEEYLRSLPERKNIHFLIDAQLPPALARWIVSQGHPATHVFDIGLQSADDPVIWKHARTESTVIISKDEDFVDHWL